MQMTGEQRVAAPRRKVWEALNDPAILARSIPGCQSLERDGENRFVAAAEVKIGPIGARFKGAVELSDLDAPNGYTITGSGNGGVAGTAKGGAKVRLSDTADGGTLVAYEVDAEVGGRMAQLGGPIIDATAKNLAGKFFAKFGEVVAGGNVPAEPGVTAPAAAVGGPAAGAVPLAPSMVMATTAAGGIWGWTAALVMAVLAGFLLGSAHMQVEMLVVLVLLIVTAAAGFEAGRRGARR
ncbi:carbon monoxide dehydrogenase subunit G [Novosphingobium sp. PhB165]|uniref:CoxG family protein n=1 Tax=Novosphingobium sp. PhB165 TaxID=2485105 RepID=UPI001050460E|nr:carbon monoxide dehydrogenase subunit G [Novosphingobium sp. PhB165]TCM19702.1 carbon monoxide dehydrogenase subunit G [Novosphingobium sp. PhB165]